MIAGEVIISEYIKNGFGHTVVIQEAGGQCVRYSHCDSRLVRVGQQVIRGQQIATFGKGAGNIYKAHLHLDMPRNRSYARDGTYYGKIADVQKRFLDPLSRIAKT